MALTTNHSPEAGNLRGKEVKWAVSDSRAQERRPHLIRRCANQEISGHHTRPRWRIKGPRAEALGLVNTKSRETEGKKSGGRPEKVQGSYRSQEGRGTAIKWSKKSDRQLGVISAGERSNVRTTELRMRK